MNRIVLVSLFLFAIVYSAVETSSVSVNASYKQGHVRFEVVDSNKESLSGLQVVVSKGDEPSMNAVFRNGAYEVDTAIPTGITDFNLRVDITIVILLCRFDLKKERQFSVIK